MKKFEKLKNLKNYFFLIFEIIDKFTNTTSAMFNAYLISTLKFRFEKNDKINNITSAMLNDYIISIMFNAYLISTLKFEKN